MVQRSLNQVAPWEDLLRALQASHAEADILRGCRRHRREESGPAEPSLPFLQFLGWLWRNL